MSEEHHEHKHEEHEHKESPVHHPHEHKEDHPVHKEHKLHVHKEPVHHPQVHKVHKPHVHKEHKPNDHHKPKKVAQGKTNYWMIATLALIVLLGVSYFTNGFDSLSSGGLTKEEAAVKTISFVNTNLLQGESVAKLGAVTEEKGLYNVKLSVSGQEFNSFITKDGELFFPQGIEMSTTVSPQVNTPTQPETPDVVKSDKPKVELFVMSHCPYGTQAEKGILPIVNLLGDKIDFDLRFVSYAMHGQTELDEQMNQVCIKNEQSDKFNDYLSCFLEDGDGESCLTEVEISKSMLTTCVASLDEEYKITENFEDQSTWLSGRYPLFDVDKTLNEQYGVRGSPTLVINGEQVSAARSPAAYLGAICAAFNVAPEECTDSTGVSSETYAPGFGYEVGAATAASCG